MYNISRYIVKINEYLCISPGRVARVVEQLATWTLPSGLQIWSFSMSGSGSGIFVTTFSRTSVLVFTGAGSTCKSQTKPSPLIFYFTQICKSAIIKTEMLEVTDMENIANILSKL